MGRAGAFLEIDREGHGVRPASCAIRDYDDYTVALSLDKQRQQASRCMNCGVAFCQSGIPLGGSKHAVGCPLHNLIPETNDLLYRGRLDDAYARLLLNDPLPEFTGRVCPAPCEKACNLGLNANPVTINDNERALSDYGWEKGMDPLPKAPDSAPLVSIIGSGPAGLAAAWELARLSNRVRVYEKSDRPGGLLMYGIPNMKLPKWVVERRVNLMKDSGIEFLCGVDAACKADEIQRESDAVIIATGAGVPRDVSLPGRDLKGIHFAVDYLTEVTRALLDERKCNITAEGKDVVVVGGGDTGNDCVASALRQGARSITQVIRAQRLPDAFDAHEVWPAPPEVYSQGYGQRETEEIFGADPRIFSVDTVAFSGEGSVEAVHIQDLSYEGGRHLVEDAEAEIPAQLVLIAKGFLGADDGIFEAFGVKDAPCSEDGHMLRESCEGKAAVYVAGDAHMGSTLVVSAMADALECVHELTSMS